MNSGGTFRTPLFPPSAPDFEESGEAATDRPPDRPWAGRLLAGKYRVEGMLGRGGMGEVLAAHQLSLDRPVAIKVLRQHLSENGRQRFTREAMAVAKMNSDHVVRVFDAGEDDGVPFIVMERLTGRDLAAELAGGPLAPDDAVRYLLEACDAIVEAHSLGVVHRDIKPSNLFLVEGADGRRRLKVLDFGVSKWLGPSEDSETSTSTAGAGLVGTPAYASPEQLTSPASVDERTDVWSLGVVLYQCLSGRRPFAERGLPQLCSSILTTEPPPLSSERGISDDIRAIVRRCLRKRPNERFASVRELAAVLRSLEKTRRRSRWPLFGGLLGSASLVAGGVLFASRGAEKQELTDGAPAPPTSAPSAGASAGSRAVPAAPPIERTSTETARAVPAAPPIERTSTAETARAVPAAPSIRPSRRAKSELQTPRAGAKPAVSAAAPLPDPAEAGVETRSEPEAPPPLYRR